VFLIPAIAIHFFGLPGQGETLALYAFISLVTMAMSGLACLGWTAAFSVHMLAIVQDTSAGNNLIEDWPDEDWGSWIGESLYVFNGILLSLIPVAILLQTCPPARPWAVYLFTSTFWLTFPVALLSMLEVGSVMTPVSGGVWASFVRAPGAWAWFYLRTAGIVIVGASMYAAFYRYLLGPWSLPVLAPMLTTFSMVYFRWLGILGRSVREVIEARMEEDEG